MAAPNFDISRPGQVNGAGDVDAMFLKIFGGEVLTQFERMAVTNGRHFTRTITSGKSAAFPNIGRVAAEYHVPGQYLTGLSIEGAETIITIDDKLVSHVSIADVDEFKAHFDFRSPYTQEMARALAFQYDSHILQLGCLAAAAENVLDEADGGTLIYTDDADLTPAAPDFSGNTDHFVEALFLAAQRLDEKYVPEDQRYLYVTPRDYYRLTQHDKTISEDFSSGNGDYAKALVKMIAGFQIVKTVHLPSTDLSAVTDVRAGTGNKYRGDFTNTKALIMHPQAVGSVMFHGIKTGSDGYQEATQAQLFVAKYLLGHGILRPQCAARIVDADAPIV